MCTREGRNPSINLEHYQEALKYPETRLTMSVLRGDRKQSVRDAELIFNPNFLKWLVSKGYTTESEYVEAVLGWHRANDERGLSEEERSSLNKCFLQYILDDLMPWNHSHDFSHLEVNRYFVHTCRYLISIPDKYHLYNCHLNVAGQSTMSEVSHGKQPLHSLLQ